MLNMRYLRYFMATARHGSFTRAAEQISISKSAIVRAVDALEEDFGTRLVVRERAKGVRLTNDGAHLYKMGQDLFQDIHNLEARMSEPGSVSGQLVLACIESLAACIIPDLLSQLEHHRPDLELVVLEDTPDKCVELVREGEADVLISAKPIAQTLPDWLDYKVLLYPALCATLSADDPLAWGPELSLEQLMDHPLVLISKPYVADMSLLYFRRLEREPRISAHTNTIENMRALVGKGFGYGLTHFRPQVDLAFTGAPLTTRPVSGVSPGIEIIAGYASRNEDWLPLKTRVFVEETRHFFRSNACRRYFIAHEG